MLRHHLEYGWERRVTDTDVMQALAAVRRILNEGARDLLAQRPTLVGRIETPS